MMTKRKWLAACGIAAAILIVSVWGGSALAKIRFESGLRKNEPVETVQSAAPEADVESGQEEWVGRIRYNGQTYRKNPDLRLILFMGIDNAPTDMDYAAFGTGGRSDALVLIILNRKTEQFRTLMISRDTMTTVDVYDAAGRKAYSGKMQLALQYSFGDSPGRSAYLTKQAVSDLLYGIRIDGYLSFTMDGIAPVVDSLGGLRLTLSQDYTQIDDSYVEGAEIVLSGAEADSFIRYRDTAAAGSNDDRMERQGRMLGALLEQLRHSALGLNGLLDAAGPYMATDLDAETMRTLFRSRASGEVLTVPGETTTGELHDEFYVDDDRLKPLLTELLYQPAD